MDRHATALQVAAAVRAGEISPSEVLEHYLTEVDRLDPLLNAFCLRDDERARAEARAADDAVAAARREGTELPPFAGVPVPIKDLYDVEGWVTGHGSLAVPDAPADEDELSVARLRGAGFVLMGKTTTPEFGAISCTECARTGITRNPWNPDHTPGGSSGGAAAAVASGMAPVGHASDGGGSIRIPSSCTGLVGLKPSRGRVTSRVADIVGASTDGVVAIDVADAAALLDVLGPLDPGAWNVAPPHGRPYAEEVGADPGRVRVRLCVENALGIPVDPECADAARSVADTLADLGHEVKEAPPVWPDAEQFLEHFVTIWNTLSVLVPVTDEGLLEPQNRAAFEASRQTSATALIAAEAALQRASRAFTAQFGPDGEFDVLVGPTMAVVPPRAGTIMDGVDEMPEAPVMNAVPMACFTALFNATGQPAISVPAHVSSDGLPVGVQLAAAPWREDLLIRLASQLERTRPWTPLPEL
jgi:amidase